MEIDLGFVCLTAVLCANPNEGPKRLHRCGKGNRPGNAAVPDDIEQKLATRPASPLRRLGLWAWLVLLGIATVGWLIGIGWAVVELFRWVAG